MAYGQNEGEHTKLLPTRLPSVLYTMTARIFVRIPKIAYRFVGD